MSSTGNGDETTIANTNSDPGGRDFDVKEGESKEMFGGSCDFAPSEAAGKSSTGVLRSAYVQTERTLLLVQPDAVQHLILIETKLRKKGFFVLQRRRVHLTPEQASEFFDGELTGTPGYPRLVAYMSSAPVVALCLTKKDAIAQLNTLLGPADVREARTLYPKCMRAIFGNVNDSMRNGLHSPEDEEMAEFEIHFFFPNMILEPVWTEEKVKDYLACYVTPTLNAGLTEVCKMKPVDPVLWLAHWLLINNPYKPSTDKIIPTDQTFELGQETS